MQPPAEESLPLGGAPATVVAPAHLLAARRPHPLADRGGQRVHHECFPGGEGHAQRVEQQAEPVGEAMGAPIEARDRERAGEVAEGAHDAERALVMVLEVARRHHRHGQHLRIARARLRVGAVAEGAHQVVNHHVHRYNQRVVHRPPPRVWRRQATPFSRFVPMNDH